MTSAMKCYIGWGGFFTLYTKNSHFWPFLALALIEGQNKDRHDLRREKLHRLVPLLSEKD